MESVARRVREAGQRLQRPAQLVDHRQLNGHTADKLTRASAATAAILIPGEVSGQ